MNKTIENFAVRLTLRRNLNYFLEITEYFIYW